MISHCSILQPLDFHISLGHKTTLIHHLQRVLRHGVPGVVVYSLYERCYYTELCCNYYSWEIEENIKIDVFLFTHIMRLSWILSRLFGYHFFVEHHVFNIKEFLLHREKTNVCIFHLLPSSTRFVVVYSLCKIVLLLPSWCFFLYLPQINFFCIRLVRVFCFSFLKFCTSCTIIYTLSFLTFNNLVS